MLDYRYLYGTEELGHLEMVGTIVYQLTRNLTEEDVKAQGFEDYFVDHTTGVYPTASSGMPYSAATMQVKGDLITDLHEDMAAEQKARTTYDNILRFCDDPDVKDAIRFLRAREVVHYQRFGEPVRTNCNILPFFCSGIFSDLNGVILSIEFQPCQEIQGFFQSVFQRRFFYRQRIIRPT